MWGAVCRDEGGCNGVGAVYRDEGSCNGGGGVGGGVGINRRGQTRACGLRDKRQG